MATQNPATASGPPIKPYVSAADRRAARIVADSTKQAELSGARRGHYATRAKFEPTDAGSGARRHQPARSDCGLRA
jgi:hypothetical protein